MPGNKRTPNRGPILIKDFLAAVRASKLYAMAYDGNDIKVGISDHRGKPIGSYLTIKNGKILPENSIFSGKERKIIDRHFFDLGF